MQVAQGANCYINMHLCLGRCVHVSSLHEPLMVVIVPKTLRRLYSTKVTICFVCVWFIRKYIDMSDIPV